MHTAFVQLFFIIVLCSQVSASNEIPKGDFRAVQEQVGFGWVENWQQGRMQARLGNYDLATTFYDATLRQRPGAGQARLEYGKLAFDNSDFAKAESLVTTLLEKEPHRNEYRFFIAQIYMAQGRIEEAERAFFELHQHTANQEENLLVMEQLAQVYLLQGKRDEALPLLRKLLLYSPQNVEYRKVLASTLLHLGHFDAVKEYGTLLKNGSLSSEVAVDVARQISEIPMSRWLRVSLYEQYLIDYPQDRLARRELGFLYNDLGQYDRALDHLLFLCNLPYVDPGVYLVVAEIYSQRAGRPDKALLYYEKYRQKGATEDVSHEIEGIQNLLAQDLSVLIQNGGGEQLWDDLGSITATPQDIFLKIAQEFRASGEDELARETLGYLVAAKSKEMSLDIAKEFLRLGEADKSLAVIEEIPKKSRGLDYYVFEAKLKADLGRGYQAYVARLHILTQGGVNEIDGQHLLEETFFFSSLSGLNAVREYYPSLLQDPKNRLAIAQVYSNNALFTQAELFLKSSSGDPSSRRAEELLRADNYRLQSLWYEAEELYRKLLFETKFPVQATEKLMELAFVEKKIEDATLWYRFLQLKYEGFAEEQRTDAMKAELDLLQARLLIKSNDPYRAQDILTTRRQKILQKANVSQQLQVRIDEALCQSSLLIDDEYSCTSVLGSKEALSLEYTYLPLSQSVLQKMPDQIVLRRVDRALGMERKKEAGVLLTELDRRGVRSSYVDMLQARFLVLDGNYNEAFKACHRFTQKYPDEPFFKIVLSSIEGKLGQYQNEYTMLTTMLDSAQTTISTTQLRLQKARTLWRLNQKDASLALYASLQDELAGDLQSLEGVPERYFKKSYWQQVATLFDNPVNSVDRIMAPSFLLTVPEKSTVDEVNELYSSYRWHRLISREYQARNAAYQKRLVMAERNYRVLLEEKQAQDVMPDLAPIYQRLGDYESEARVYHDVQESGVNIDYLATSMDENQKQLQPKLDSFVLFSNREGRSGSIDMRKYQAGTDFGFTPKLGQEYHFSYVLTDYNGESKSQVGQMLASSAQFTFSDDLGLDLGLGFEKTNHGGDLSALGHAVVRYRVLDHLRSYVGWSQVRVDDTIESVRDDLLGQDISMGAIYESPSGLDLGLEYIYRFLSNSNEQERLNAWTEYTFFSDQAELGLRYDFEFFAGKNIESDSSYWNPDDFRKQSFSVSFRYNLDEELAGEQSLKRYYELATRLGVEDDDNISYTTEFDIFLEMNPQFLLKGSLLYSKSDDYDESAGLLHLIYRW